MCNQSLDEGRTNSHDNASAPRTYVLYDPEAPQDDVEITNEMESTLASHDVPSIHDYLDTCDHLGFELLVMRCVFQVAF